MFSMDDLRETIERDEPFAKRECFIVEGDLNGEKTPIMNNVFISRDSAKMDEIKVRTELISNGMVMSREREFPKEEFLSLSNKSLGSVIAETFKNGRNLNEVELNAQRDREIDGMFSKFGRKMDKIIADTNSKMGKAKDGVVDFARDVRTGTKEFSDGYKKAKEEAFDRQYEKQKEMQDTAEKMLDYKRKIPSLEKKKRILQKEIDELIITGMKNGGLTYEDAQVIKSKELEVSSLLGQIANAEKALDEVESMYADMKAKNFDTDAKDVAKDAGREYMGNEMSKILEPVRELLSITYKSGLEALSYMKNELSVAAERAIEWDKAAYIGVVSRIQSIGNKGVTMMRKGMCHSGELLDRISKNLEKEGIVQKGRNFASAALSDLANSLKEKGTTLEPLKKTIQKPENQIGENKANKGSQSR